MDDYGDELRDIKREIVESRGLVIKTNNLTNALAADLKSISKRQLGFERRAFWQSATASVLFVVVVIALWRLTHSPYGRVLSAIRQSETRAAHLGYQVWRYKASVFTISTVLPFIIVMISPGL